MVTTPLVDAVPAGAPVVGAGALVGVVVLSEPPVLPAASATAGVEPAVTATAVARAAARWRTRTVVVGRNCGARRVSWVRAASWSRVSCSPGVGRGSENPSSATTWKIASGNSMTSSGSAKTARHSSWLPCWRVWVSSRRSSEDLRAGA